MRVLTIACVLFAAAASATSAGASSTDGEAMAEMLDLTNWGFSVFYLDGNGLVQEANGLEGLQEDSTTTADGVVSSDPLVLP